MLTRFELFVILRNQVADRQVVRRSLAHEAGMEALARLCGADVTMWGMAGLGAAIDAELAAHNPARRGEVARELLLAEGAPAEVADVARDRLAEEPAGAAAALVVVEAIAALVFESGFDDDFDARLVAHRLRKRDPRAVACAARAGVDLDEAAVAVAEAMRAIREDLRL